MKLELLLAHADDQRPVLDHGLPPDSIAHAGTPTRSTGNHFRYDAGDPDALPDQRWGLVVPEGPEGARLLGVIEPLRLARQRAQKDATVRVYHVPSGMSAQEASRWKQQVYWDESVPEEDLPRYLLILGDLDQVSLDLQQILSADTYVGRLAFADEQAYACYVDKVLRSEREPQATAARSLFYTVRDGTAATTVGHHALMAPIRQRCLDGVAKGGFRASEVLEVEGLEPTSIHTLLEQAARPEPTVLFSMSHGLGAPRAGWKSLDEQRALQGAMSLGSGQKLTAADITGRPFLPGGVWFFLACYGAGTPASSAYAHWLQRLKAEGMFPGRVDSVLASLPKSGERPFVASLPQAVLANPEGPLAVIGHVDLAWTYSFQDMDLSSRSRPSRFQHVFKALVDGKRVGLGHRELFRFFAEASLDLTALVDAEEARAARGVLLPEDPGRRIEKAHLWMLRQDLAGYMLLGDPAARLRVSPQSDPPH